MKAIYYKVIGKNNVFTVFDIDLNGNSMVGGWTEFSDFASKTTPPYAFLAYLRS